ncbi:MAG: hypothetical protein V2A70_00985, partial [Candidatus Omnitrophota bacterium]
LNYTSIWNFFRKMTPGIDYTDTAFTDTGMKKYQQFIQKFNLSENRIAQIAEDLFDAQRLKKNVNYVVERKQHAQWHKKLSLYFQKRIVIVDISTGRKKYSTKWRKGLHQFVELKEGIRPSEDLSLMASVTHPAFFAKYHQIYSITGTIGSEVERGELREIYGLDSIQIPTNKFVQRADLPDAIENNDKDQMDILLTTVQDVHQHGQPVIIVFNSIAQTIQFHSLLKQRTGINAKLLNGMQRIPEEVIIQQAGQVNAVTIATNMATRGVDILLGPAVEESGGLYVIGTSHFRSERIDDQLRGRAGRQGRPGTSQFVISLEQKLYKKYLSIESIKDLKISKDTKYRQSQIKHAQALAESHDSRTRINIYRIFQILDEQMRKYYGEISRLYYSNDWLPLIYNERNFNVSLSTFAHAFYVSMYSTYFEKLDEQIEQIKFVHDPSNFEKELNLFKKSAEESMNKLLTELRNDFFIEYSEEYFKKDTAKAKQRYLTFVDFNEKFKSQRSPDQDRSLIMQFLAVLTPKQRQNMLEGIRKVDLPRFSGQLLARES